MWHMNGGGHFWGMHMLWWVFWLLVAFVFFAYVAFASKGQRPFQRDTRESPLVILKRRYAAGEIDTEEFNIRKRELEKDGHLKT